MFQPSKVVYRMSYDFIQSQSYHLGRLGKLDVKPRLLRDCVVSRDGTARSENGKLARPKNGIAINC